MTAPSPDARLKMLSYRAWRRGLRETDLILGPFADAYLADLTPAEIDAFEHLLDQPDQDLYVWFKGAPAPAGVDPGLLDKIRAFHAGGGAVQGR